MLFYVIMFLGWKIIKKSKFIHPKDVDLTLGESKNEVDDYEMIMEEKPVGKAEQIMLKVLPM